MSKNIKRIGIAQALFSAVQLRVMGLLFGEPDRRFQGVEVLRLAKGGTGAVHRVLSRLEASGLVSTSRVGNQKFYQANRQAPVFPELHGLIAKTVGLIPPLARALAPLEDRIVAAWAFVSTPSRSASGPGTTTPTQEVDVIVVSDSLAHAELEDALGKAGFARRTLNPILLTRATWAYHSTRTDSFAARINAPGKLYIIGSDDTLG